MKIKSAALSSSLIAMVIMLLLIASGCTSKSVEGEVYNEKGIPKTPEAAGIKTFASTSCEGCHLDPAAISSFEKPKEESTGGETVGG